MHEALLELHPLDPVAHLAHRVELVLRMAALEAEVAGDQGVAKVADDEEVARVGGRLDAVELVLAQVAGAVDPARQDRSFRTSSRPALTWSSRSPTQRLRIRNTHLDPAL